MYRVVVSLTFSLLIAALALWCHSALRGAAERDARAAAGRELALSLEALRHLQRLEGAALTARARQLSDDERLVTLLQARPKVTEDYLARHDGVDALLLGWRDALAAQEKQGDEGAPLADGGADLAGWGAARPYALFVVDRGGVCVAHISNPRCYAQDEQGSEFTRMADLHPPLKAALAGERFFDIWTVDGQPVLVAASPVWAPGASRVQARGEVVGAVVVGHLLSRVTQRHKAALGVEVGLVYGEGVEGGAPRGGTTLEGKREVALREALRDPLTASALSAHQLTEVDLLDERHWLRAAPVAGYKSAEGARALVALSWTERARAQALSAPPVLPAAAGALLVALVVFWGASQRYIKPFKELELGVIEVTSGNLNYWFTYSVPDNGVTGSLAQNLDVMVSKYSGRPMPELEGEAGGAQGPGARP